MIRRTFEKRWTRLTASGGNLDGDTFFSPGTRAAALDAAGGTTALARMVQRGEADWGFAAVRPPGHHATARRACGFCIFNNIALAAADLLAETDAKRVAIFDWDVHHGNGTQDIFYDRPDVLYVSIHQWPHFPGSGLVGETGRGSGTGTTINLPFPAGATDADYRAAMTDVVIPAMERFRPDHILVSAGYDAHREDFLGGMLLSSRMFGEMAARLKQLADGICKGRMTLALEGGYHLEALADSVCETIRGLFDPRIPECPPYPPGAGVRRILDAVRREISLPGNGFPE